MTHNGQTGFLTASHCTEVQFGADNTGATQNYSSTTTFAHEAHDPDDYNCGFRECRPSDASFFGLDAGNTRPITLGLIAKWPGIPYASHVYDSSDLWVVTEEEHGDLYVGTTVMKVGAVSGQSSGQVTSTCVDHWGDRATTTTDNANASGATAVAGLRGLNRGTTSRRGIRSASRAISRTR